MQPRDVLDVRKFAERVARNQYPHPMYARYWREMVTVQVTADFARYVYAMAEQWPKDAPMLEYPTVEEARWPFKDQSVCFVFPEPLDMEFLITSVGPGARQEITPVRSTDPVVALILMPPAVNHSIRIKIGEPGGEVLQELQPTPESMAEMLAKYDVYPALYIHPDETITDGTFSFGMSTMKRVDTEQMGWVVRFQRSLIEALSQKLSKLDPPWWADMDRRTRRAIQRSEAPYRVLDLRTPDRATDQSNGEHHTVNWTKRWMVRGFWRNPSY